MSEITINLDYSGLKADAANHMSDEAEEKRLDELDELFPQIMALKQQEDLLLGFPVTKYDAKKKNYYVLHPNGDKVYG
jgi:hypothetical protein